MKAIKKNKMVETLLDMAREHVQLATVDLDFVDMAMEEISVVMRIATPKKGYTEKDVEEEIYEYTGLLNQSSAVLTYIYTVSAFKLSYKHSDSDK
jgi:hypothetical protein